MRAIKVVSHNGKPTITKEEYLELKESLKDSFDPDKVSILNRALTKRQGYHILFNDKLTINDKIGYMHFFNIVREFVVEKKTFHNWKVLQNYKPIKDLKEIRKEKINKIENNI